MPAAGDEPHELGPLGETDVEIATDDGLVDIGDAEVPDVVDDDFPIPDGLDIQLASSSGDDAGFSGVTDSTFDELLDYFETELPAAGYDVARSQFVDGTVAVIDFSGSERDRTTRHLVSSRRWTQCPRHIPALTAATTPHDHRSSATQRRRDHGQIGRAQRRRSDHAERLEGPVRPRHARQQRRDRTGPDVRGREG